ncbi:hypothetical protein PGB90_008045 [Kerria lacca]
MVRDIVDRHLKLKRGDTKTDNITVKLQNLDNANLYYKVLEYEEQEALQRAGDNDMKLFKETCKKFSNIIKTVADLKSSNDTSNSISNLRIDGSMLFVKLKKLNRLEKFRLNNAREKLYDTKRQVDNLHLQWQNLLYETHHLKKEISNCLSFKSKDEHIELIPVEDFYKNAPHSISRPEVTKNDDHQLRLARLEWELNQRKILAETCNDLEEEKEQIASEIKRKKDRIENLVPMIKNILAVTKPVQEHLGLPMSQIQSEPELVQLLPPSLYFLSIQANAMHEACDPLIKFTIIGDKDSAERVNYNISELTLIEDSDSEEENKNHHHRRKTKTQIREEKIKKLLMKHPLSAKLEILLKNNGSISIIFHYLINLRIITIVPTVNTKTFEGICCRYLLDSRNVLNGIFHNDYGDRSPNSANVYQLEQARVEFNSSDLGIPYLWAQKLCGLDFTGRTHSTTKILDLKTNADQRNMSITVQKIRQHFKTIIELCEQLQDIENLILPLKFRDLTTIPVKVACTLTKWEILSWERFVTYENAEHFISTFDISEHDHYFEGTFARNSATLTTLIIITPNYPTVPSIFSLKIDNNGKKYTAQNNNDVRDIEKELNYYVKELFEKLGKRKNWILTAQLYKLAICFDIFLEATDRDNFPREKLFYYHVRGRTRSLPFKYVKRGTEGFFVQR